MSTSPIRPEEFRLDSPPAIEALLRQLLHGQRRVVLSTPEGISLHTRLWTLDGESGQLSFEVGKTDAQLPALLDCPEVVATAYLEQIRIEFELDALVLVKGDSCWTLRAAIPPVLYRFQRRQAYRVQPLSTSFPRVLLTPPAQPGNALRLRVLDLSITGIALALPAEAQAIGIGTVLKGVRVELDRDSHFEAELSVQHTSLATGESSGTPAGWRLGCAFVSLPAGAERELQAYIDLTQKRQRLLKRH